MSPVISPPRMTKRLGALHLNLLLTTPKGRVHSNKPFFYQWRLPHHFLFSDNFSKQACLSVKLHQPRKAQNQQVGDCTHLTKHTHGYQMKAQNETWKQDHGVVLIKECKLAFGKCRHCINGVCCAFTWTSCILLLIQRCFILNPRPTSHYGPIRMQCRLSTVYGALQRSLPWQHILPFLSPPLPPVPLFTLLWFIISAVPMLTKARTKWYSLPSCEVMSGMSTQVVSTVAKH